MKKLIVLFFIVLLLVASKGFVSALENTNTVRTSDKTQVKASVKPERIENSVSNLKERANKEITRRITALNSLLSKVSALKRISSADKASFSSQIQTQIDNLTALKVKIDADTDLATLKTDVKSIVSEYRIFALFMPKIRLLSASESILTASDSLSSLSARIKTKLDETKASGKDTSSEDRLLNDMNAKIADAKSLANMVILAVAPLTPEGYPANRATLVDAKTKLKTALSDLKTAREDARKIIGTTKTKLTPRVLSPTPTPSI